MSTSASSKSENLNPSTVVYKLLKRDIISGLYDPGSKLRMSELKSHYSIGTGPMREVLSQLVSERLVTTMNQKGFRVAEISLEEMRDIYDARAHLEAMIVQLAVERGDDQWEAEIIGKAYSLNRVSEISSPEDMLNIWDKRHKEFHTAIAKGCGSPKLLEVRASLLDHAERYRQIWLKQTVFSSEALEKKRQEHQDLVNAILERDASKVGQLILIHLMTPVPVITNLLNNSEETM